LYYDEEGKMQTAGAEADTPAMNDLAEDNNWIRAEL
jgi:hypothetical protein